MMPSTRNEPKQEPSGWVEDTIYCAATCPPEDIFYHGSEDENYEDSTTRKLRYEAAGRRFLAGDVPYLISASLLGPFDKRSGWTNPWRSRLRTRTTSPIDANAHGPSSSQQAHYPQSPVRQATRRQEVSDSLECHLPSPESLKQAILTEDHPFLEQDELAAVIHWRARLPASDSPTEMLNQSNSTEAQSHKKRTTSISGIFDVSDRKKRKKSRLFSESSAKERSDARVSFHSAPGRFEESFASPSLDLNMPNTHSEEAQHQTISQAAAAAMLSSPTSLLGSAHPSAHPLSPCKQTKRSRLNKGNPHMAQSFHASSDVDVSTCVKRDAAKSSALLVEGKPGPETQQDESFCYKLRGQIAERSVSNTPISGSPTPSALKAATNCHKSDAGSLSEASSCPDSKIQAPPDKGFAYMSISVSDEQAAGVSSNEPETQDFQILEVSNIVALSNEDDGSTMSGLDDDSHSSNYSDNVSGMNGTPGPLKTISPLREVGLSYPQDLLDDVTAEVVNDVTDVCEDKHALATIDSPVKLQSPVDGASSGTKSSPHTAKDAAAFPVPDNSTELPSMRLNGHCELDETTSSLKEKEDGSATASASAWEDEEAMVDTEVTTSKEDISSKDVSGNSPHEGQPQSPWSRTQPLNDKIEQTPSKHESSPRPIPPDLQSPWVAGSEMVLSSFAMPAPKFVAIDSTCPDVIAATDDSPTERPGTPEPQFPVRSFASFMTPSPERAPNRRHQLGSASRHTPNATHASLSSALKNPWSGSRVIRRVSWALLPHETDENAQLTTQASPCVITKLEVSRGSDRALSPPPATTITPSMMEDVSEQGNSSFIKHFDTVARRKRDFVTLIASSPAMEHGIANHEDESPSSAVSEAEPMGNFNSESGHERYRATDSNQEDVDMERPVDIMEDLFHEIGDVFDVYDLDTELEQAKNATQPRPSQLEAGLFGQW
jgi:hypothetical protein